MVNLKIKKTKKNKTKKKNTVWPVPNKQQITANNKLKLEGRHVVGMKADKQGPAETNLFH